MSVNVFEGGILLGENFEALGAAEFYRSTGNKDYRRNSK